MGRMATVCLKTLPMENFTRGISLCLFFQCDYSLLLSQKDTTVCFHFCFHFKVLLFAASFQCKDWSSRFSLFGLSTTMLNQLRLVEQRTAVQLAKKPQNSVQPPTTSPLDHLTPTTPPCSWLVALHEKMNSIRMFSVYPKEIAHFIEMPQSLLYCVSCVVCHVSCVVLPCCDAGPMFFFCCKSIVVRVCYHLFQVPWLAISDKLFNGKSLIRLDLQP